MKFQSNIHVLSFLRTSVNAASIVVFAVGLVVMLGWIMDISTLRSIVPGLPAMRFNTALSFLLLGSSLWFLQTEKANPARKGIGKALAGLTLLISLLTLTEYLFGWDLGIDELLIKDLYSPTNLFPGRMSPIAVLCSSLSSTALLVIGSRISQYFSLGVFVLSLVGVMNFLFGFQILLRNPQNTYSAVQTAGAFLILSLALLAARPTYGMMKMLSSDLPGSKAMRLLLPVIVIITLFMGWLVEWAESLGYLDTGKESILLVIVLTFVYSPLIYFIARNINQAEEGMVYANRLYATLSQVNQAIARLKSQQELFESICKIAVDFGKFRLTWVGLFDHDSGYLTPVAIHSSAGLKLPFEAINAREMPFKEGLIGVALTSGQAQFSDDLTVDHRTMHWRKIALKDDYRSAAVIPIRQMGQVVGLLNLYAADAGFFMVREEQSLLEQIGLDISFALDAMATEAERRWAEEMLRESEQKFSILFEKSSFAVSLSRLPEGIIVNINEAFERAFGYAKQEVIGKTSLDLGINPDSEGRARILAALSEYGSVRNQELALHTKSGELRIFSVNIDLVDISGQKYILNATQDINDQKQAEEQIQRQLKYLSALRMIDIAISSSFDLHVILDVVLQQVLSQLGVDASAILLFNAQLQTIEYAASCGFRSEALHYTDLKLGEGFAGQAVIERKTIHISDLMETGGKLARSLLLEHESFVEYYGTPLIVKGEVKGVLEIYHRSHLKGDAEWLEFLEALAGQAAIAIDNAQLFENLQRAKLELEHRVAERTAELNRTNTELEHASQIKDEFLANMSHELRTPLTSILGLSESLLEQRRASLNEHQQRSLQIIASSGRHLLELINDILDLSKIEAGKFDYYPQPISVDEICRSSLAFVKSQAVKKSITVTYLNEVTLSKIYADPRRLKQILVNLLSNAVKFTREQGEVILQVKADLEQDIIKFSVIDNGIGIAPQDLRRLFQPFVQVDSGLNRQHEGTGLGLALVQKLTDLHGGSVHVESEVGKGSRFTVNLACKQDEIAKLENLQSQTTRPFKEQVKQTEDSIEMSSQRGVILLAEDNMPNILTISEYLKSHGYEVVVAHDGSEALKKAEAMNPDLILMDIQMPVMDGLEAIARLRGNVRFADTPIIALTALAMPGDRERGLLAGANEYMSKPVSLKALLREITRLLRGSSEG